MRNRQWMRKIEAFGIVALVVALLCALKPLVSDAQPQAGSYDQMVAAARTLIAQKKPQEAVAQSEKAIQLDDKRWEGYVTAASGYSAQQLYDDAVGMLQMALVRAPEDKKQLVRDSISEARQLSARPAGATNAPRAAPTASPSTPTQAEIVLWKSIENSTHIEDFRAYLQKYPEGTYSTLALARLERLESDAASEAKAKDAENARKGEEDARRAEVAKYTFPVAHLHARLTLSGNPGCYGHLVVTPEGIAYQGDADNLMLSKADVTYMDIANTGAGSFARFHTSNGAWSYAAIDEADVQNRKFKGAYPPNRIGNAIVERWGFVATGDNKRLVPSGH